jgi:hypothetical protein
MPIPTDSHSALLDQIVDTVNIVVNKETGLPIGFDMTNITDPDLIANKEYLKTIAYLNAYNTKMRQLIRFLEIISERGNKEEDEARVTEKIQILKVKIKELDILKKRYEKEHFSKK